MGEGYGCALGADKIVHCWGRDANGYAELSGRPRAVSGLGKTVELAVGGNHACARAVDGRIRCWGANSSGQLGTGKVDASDTPYPQPQRVVGVEKAVSLSMVPQRACAVVVPGQVQCWGETRGRSGHRWTPPAFAPLTDVTAVSTSEMMICVRRDGGRVQCDAQGHLIQQLVPPPNLRDVVQIVTGGWRVCLRYAARAECEPGVPSLGNVRHIALGRDHGVAIKQNGQVVWWGEDHTDPTFKAIRAQRWPGPSGPPHPRIEDVGITDGIKAAEGGLHTCVLRRDERVACWGDNENGQLGDGTTTARGRAVDAPITDVVSLGAGDSHTCVATTGGEVFCWGANRSGQIGAPASAHSLSPHRVDIDDVVEVTAAGDTACARRRGGDVWCWGSNLHGLLGTARSPYRTQAEEVRLPAR